MSCLHVIFRSFPCRLHTPELRPAGIPAGLCTALTFAQAATGIGLASLILWTASANPAQARQVSVDEATFIVTLDANPDDDVTYSYQSTRVPFLPGKSCYGWRMRLSDAGKVVNVKEVLTLPSDPAYWPHEASEFDTTAKFTDRTTTITERYVTPEKGWISNGWCVLEGDPKGAYSAEVSIDGQVLQRFDFEVRDMPVLRKPGG